MTYLDRAVEEDADNADAHVNRSLLRLLNGDFQNAEWGYISFSELSALNINGLEVDCETEPFWEVRKASEIKRIRDAHEWSEHQEVLGKIRNRR